MNQHISLIIITKNEQDNIKKYFGWLKKVKSINEIILVDDFSTDKTIQTLKTKIGDHQKLLVFRRKLNNDFSNQRTFAIKKASNDWILWLDADEKPSPKLINFLINFLPNTNVKSYSFLRQDIFLNYKLNHGQSINKHIRLFNKNYGQFLGKVHEIWKGSQISNLNYVFYHYSFNNLTQILHKLNFYTDIRSKELFDQDVKTNLFQIIFFPIGKFVQTYFLKRGFLDSTPGMIFSLLMSLHSFLVRAKLWHLYTQSSST